MGGGAYFMKPLVTWQIWSLRATSHAHADPSYPRMGGGAGVRMGGGAGVRESTGQRPVFGGPL